jgi:hypothetical protein
VWKPRVAVDCGAFSPGVVPGDVDWVRERSASLPGWIVSPNMVSPDRNTLPLDRTKRVPAPKVGMTPMVARPSTATQIQPEDDIPIAAAETVDFNCSKEPKSSRIAILNGLEISASLLKAFAGGGFFDVI